MKKISFEVVKQQHQSWINRYDDNNTTGKDCISFANMGQQWQEVIVQDRRTKNKESITCNVSKRHLTRLKSQGREIEFSLNVSPTTQEWEENVEETNAFRLLMFGLTLSTDMTEKFADAFDKCADFGYAVGFMSYGRENDNTLSNVPILHNLKDPSIAFFDPYACSLTKTDGRFCGLRYMVSEDELLCKYPKFEGENWVKKNNEIFDYWDRDYEKKNFYLLEGGEYKREDKLTEEDMDKVVYDENQEPIIQSGNVSCIYYTRFCNEKVIEKRRRYPLEIRLPLVYHFGMTEWHPEGERTYPFIYMLIDPQRVHNFVQSQIATMAKNSSSDKWIFNRDHARTAEAQQALRNINQNEGAFFIDKTDKDYVRERPAEIPQSMIILANATKMEIDEIAGSTLEGMENTPKVLSGKAMNAITHNINLLQTNFISSHIRFVNEIGRIYREMLPLLCTEERTLVVKKQDGGAQAITINKRLLTGKILNNIKDIDDNFHYEITAGPSSTMQKEDTRRALQETYAFDKTGNIVNSTIDIYMRMLETPYSAELARRVQPFVDPMLVKFSQGEISQEEFSAYQQKQKQQAMQMAQSAPEAQSMMSVGKAELSKAQTAQFNAETKRSETIGKAMEVKSKLELELARLITEKENADKDRDVDILKEQLKRNDAVIRDLVDASKQNNTTNAA